MNTLTYGMVEAAAIALYSLDPWARGGDGRDRWPHLSWDELDPEDQMPLMNDARVVLGAAFRASKECQGEP